MCTYFIIEKNVETIKSIKKVMMDFEEFCCIGVSNNYDDAMNTILKETPVLVFINLDETTNNPFQLAIDTKIFSSNPAEFIAISSQKQSAYNAFKAGFCDFLLCPVSDLEIRKTILTFQKKKTVKKKTCICLKSYKDYQYLSTDDILFLKADGNTTEFHMNDGRIVNAFKTLKVFEKLLPKEFSRIHKSYIINTTFVSRIQFGKSICSIKRSNVSIPFSDSYLDVIQNMNQNLSLLSFSSSLN